MSKLTEEEQSLLDELTKRSQEPDGADDFEIEVYSKDGHGARIPFSRGSKWLYDNFGIGDAPEVKAPKSDKAAKPAQTGDADASHYFGRQQKKAVGE
jgi:hypothetical protein